MRDSSEQIIIIEHPRFTARVSIRGAQLLSFVPKNGQDFLWCTTPSFLDAALAQPNKPIRGGIPICWPWFGAHSERSDLPSHGFARLMEWDLLSSEDFGEFHRLVFELKSSEFTRGLWPHEFYARVNIMLSDTCSVQLFVETDGEWTGALHTYLAVDDIAGVKISGLGSQYRDNLDNSALKAAGSYVYLDGPTEKMFVAPEPSTQIIQPYSDSIVMHHEGHSDVMLWTPWSNAGMSPADMLANDYKKMVCIETSRIQKPQQAGKLGVRLEQIKNWD